MKIFIDCFQYQQFVTGTDRQAYHFIKNLQKIDKKNDYFLLCSSEPYIPNVVHNENFHVLQPWSVKTRSAFVNRVFIKIWKIYTLARLLFKPADVFFSVHNMVLPRFRIAKRMILSNLDLIPIKLPEYFNVGRFNHKQNIIRYRRTLKMADAVVSISEFSKQEVVSTFGVNPDKVFVVHLAADEAEEIKINKKFTDKLPLRFILTIGGSETRKNVDKVILAHKQLPSHLQAVFPLLIVGGDWQGNKLPEGGNCVRLGRVSDDELRALYRRCDLFVFASSYEGFGLPILEAMQVGAPVLCATGSSLDEVAGKAAVMFTLDSSEDLENKLELILTDPKLRKRLSTASKEQAKKFSWEKSAKLLRLLLTER